MKDEVFKIAVLVGNDHFSPWQEKTLNHLLISMNQNFQVSLMLTLGNDTQSMAYPLTPYPLPVIKKKGSYQILPAGVELLQKSEVEAIIDLTWPPSPLQVSLPWGIWQWAGANIHEAENFLLQLICRKWDQEEQKAVKEKILWEGRWKSLPYSYLKTLEHALTHSFDIYPHVIQKILVSLSQGKRPSFKLLTPFAQVGLLQRLLIKIKKGWWTFKLLVQMEWCEEHWNVGLIELPLSEVIKKKFKVKIKWRKEKDREVFYADPFLITYKNRPYLLMEGLKKKEGQGYIASLEIENFMKSCGPIPQIVSPVHMSYPFLLQVEEHIFCIPETSAGRELRLYQAKNFPHQWELISVLLKGIEAVDPTLFYAEGTWWMFCTLANNGPLEKLTLWMSADLKGPWRPHPLNPVKVDISSARPAGPLFYYEGKLIRPSQDCSETYGGRVIFNEVTVLNADDFQEQAFLSFDPQSFGSFPHGLHTVASIGQLTVIDGKRYFFSFNKTINWIKQQITTGS